MKRLVIVLAVLLAASGCTKDVTVELNEETEDLQALSHELIELGEKLEDPYTVENVTKALRELYPTKSDMSLDPTDLYVRFLPRDEDQYDDLLATGLDLMDHPLDYQIVKDGDYYYDPEIGEDGITWQYAVVPSDFVFPKGIHYEILDECFLAENAPQTKAIQDIDWDSVERLSYEMTGNSDMLVPETKAERSKPEGRITIEDPSCNGGKPFGVAGLKVVCNSFIRISTATTDRDGYYSISKKYSSKIHYRLMFKNVKGFAIGFNLVLIPASLSTLGKGSPVGKDALITADSEEKLFRRCVVNNALYEYYTRCENGDLSLTPPPSNLRVWIFKKLKASSAVMLHHGAMVDGSFLEKLLGEYIDLVKLFLPDITLGLKGTSSYAEIYSLAIHEVAHASHFAKVGKHWWNKYILAVLQGFLGTGGELYGSADTKDSGYCAVGEMWAFFLQSRLYADRYSSMMPSFGNEHWFHPQTLKYLNSNGMKPAQFFAAMTTDVVDRDTFRDRLIALYPAKKDLITEAFSHS